MKNKPVLTLFLIILLGSIGLTGLRPIPTCRSGAGARFGTRAAVAAKGEE